MGSYGQVNTPQGDAGGLLWTGKYTPSTKIYWELMLSSLSTGPLTNLSAAITLSPHAIRRTLQNRRFCLSNITEKY